MKKIILIIVILILAGFGVWWFVFDDEDHDSAQVKKDSSGKILTVDSTVTKGSCDGELFDTHVHLDEYQIPGLLAPQMTKHGVTCGVLFMRVDPDDIDESVELLQESLGQTPNRFIPFMHIDPQTADEESVTRIQMALEATDIPWQGLGEVAFYRDPFLSDDLTNEKWDENFEFAADHDLIFMIHPRNNQSDELKQLLADHPNTTILFHGSDMSIEIIIDVLETYQNAYFTLDTSTLIQIPGIPGPLMFPMGEASASLFVRNFDDNKNVILENAIEKWLPVVDAAPDRVMWGTDVAFDWHTDTSVYDRLISFSEEFIEALPENQQQPFAIDNALKFFGTPLAVIPIDEGADVEED